MEYPRISHDEKKSVKLKTHDIEAIHWLFHIEKWTIPQIADRFKVVPKTIRYHLDPEFRQKEIDMRLELYNKQLLDENFRRLHYKRNHEHYVYKKKYKEFIDYIANINKKYRQDNIIYFKEYDKKYRQNNKDHLKEYHKEWYQKNKNKNII